MRIQHDATVTMNLQVEVALPHEARDDDAGAEPQVVVWPTGGDGTTLTHRWSFTPDEAEQLARTLQDAADRARSMV